MTAEDIVPAGFKRCECGNCEQLIPERDRRSRETRRFVKGHYFIYAKRGPEHFNWKGGRTFTGTYTRLHKSDHPRANKKGWVYEHIVVMEEKIGRPLKDGETVHHINEIKTDNRPENLELFSSRSEHKSFHMRKVWSMFNTSGRSLK